MPGHVNVLLAEGNVPYEQLVEMDEANSELQTADVTLVVGANDSINPAAKDELLDNPKTMLVFGDARDTSTKVPATVKNG
jgi:NAD(P) transhydrogenase subunit beta